MADEVVRTITIRGKGDGLDQLTDALKKVAEAQGAVPVVADKSTKSLSSVEQAYQKQTLRLDENARSQAQAATQTKIADAALAQGLVTQAEHAARLDLINNKYGQATLGSKAFAAATTGVSGQLIAMSAGAGPVGVFLSALGPWGIAAAVGLGAVTAAFGAAIESANKLATGAIEMRRFSDETGLTTLQLKALTLEAAKHGIQAEETVAAITKFTVAWAEMRDGGGKLLTDIRKLDPALADQMQVTKDSATAFDLLSQAIAKADAAGDIAARNQLLRAAGGRGGVSALAGIAAGVNDAGGIDQMAKKFTETHVALDGGLMQDLIKLKTETDELNKYADKLFASIGAKSVMEAQSAWAKLRVEAGETAVALAKAEESKGFWDWFFYKLAQTSEGGAGLDAVRRYATSLTAVPTTKVTQGPDLPDLTAPKTLKAQAEDLKNVIALLGSAATGEERRQLKLAELNATINQNASLEGLRGRAIKAIELDADTARINARVSALGIMANSTDVATQAQTRLTKANIDGAGVSPTQIKLLIEESQIKLATTKQNIDASFGLTSATDILKLKTDEYLNTAKQRNYTDEQTAAGLLVVARNAKAAYEASQVAASAHPQLTQLGFDAGNLDKQFDTVAVGGFNNLTTALTDISMGTTTAGAAFRNLGLQVIRSLQEMIIKIMVVQPLVKALQSSLSGVGGGFSLSSLFGGGGAAAGAGSGTGLSLASTSGLYAKGGAFEHGYPVHAFADGGIVNNPTIFPMANGSGLMGEAGPEAIMPLKRGSDGRLGVAAGGGSGASSTTHVVYSPVYHLEGTAEEIQRVKQQAADDRREFDKRVGALFSNPNSAARKSMSANTNTSARRT